MIHYLRSLFTRNATIKQQYKKYTRLTSEQKNNLVTDKFINKMRYAELAVKYNVSIATVGNILRAARRLQRKV